MLVNSKIGMNNHVSSKKRNSGKEPNDASSKKIYKKGKCNSLPVKKVGEHNTHRNNEKVPGIDLSISIFFITTICGCD